MFDYAPYIFGIIAICNLIIAGFGWKNNRYTELIFNGFIGIASMSFAVHLVITYG